MPNVTEMFDAIGRGEQQASDELLPLLYDELRKLAQSRLSKESPGQTLQATELVHEAYLRLVEPNDRGAWDNRGHFFAAAAEAMRRILVERVRAKRSLKRGGDRERFEMREGDLIISIPVEQIVEVNDAIERLAEESPVTAQIVEMRCFAGLTMEEIASALNMSRTTATKHWAYARAWIAELLDLDQSTPQD
ncbi:MAG: sigma-70 family RNA polymerase sigma factor [Planctomycetaceae bacterium]|nr:sigma-70 family RNA polymerase sigma factor [Planctomycetaceae bacterium]